ncbi:hypothetical protein ACFO3J_33345 [Streptomyces polygonati]|uniref:Uncharacterized protein n=1 Tax=Streptomyces polygonati TaxID=1617087 RepID=A0ABV8HZD2_9ACTN
MIAAPGSLQQARGILRDLADHHLTPDAAAGTHHTRPAFILASAIIWSSRRR